jgi:ABC-2 type transport system permease protein
MTTTDTPVETSPSATAAIAPTKPHRRRSRTWVIAKTDLHQLRLSRDFWIPLAVIAVLFFVLIPAALLAILSSLHDVALVNKLSGVVTALPAGVQKTIRASVHGNHPELEASYALAVFLFAPLAVMIPLTVSSAVAANAVIGERERGSGEFLAHSPATTREIYLGKMIASLVPGYLTAALGFGLYSLVVDLIVGTKLGSWFFPTESWWLLMLFVVPPCIALAVAVIIAISARVSSSAAAQQASSLISLPLIGVAYAISSGTFLTSTWSVILIGLGLWAIAVLVLIRLSRSVTRERLLGVGSE